jgi:hypothetical protein
MRKCLIAAAVCLLVLTTIACVASLHYNSMLFSGTMKPNKMLSVSAPASNYLTEQIHSKESTISKLLSEIDNLRATNQKPAQELEKQAQELNVKVGSISSSNSGHRNSNSGSSGGEGGGSNSVVSLFGLHGVKVMPFCNQSDGSFLPPLVSFIQAPLSLSHLLSVSCFAARLAHTRLCRSAKTIWRVKFSSGFRLRTR